MIENKTGETPQVLSYVVASDTGFAPNIDGGVCTLAVCKPIVRKFARPGDFIVGLTAAERSDGNKKRVVYFMEVEETISFDNYFNDRRFKRKHPPEELSLAIISLADNIYEPQGAGFLQLPSRHSKPDGSEDLYHKTKDLKGKSVLVSARFSYFGDEAAEINENLEKVLHVRRGHRSLYSPRQRENIIEFLEELEPGIHGKPAQK